MYLQEAAGAPQDLDAVVAYHVQLCSQIKQGLMHASR